MHNIYEEYIEPLLGLVVFVLIILAIGFVCNGIMKLSFADLVPTSQFYDNVGISGSHNFAVLDSTGSEVNGDIHGQTAFFLFVGAGSIDGQFHQGDVVQIKWVTPDGLTQIASVPYSMIKWDYDSAYTSPYFEFNFSQAHLNQMISNTTELINYNTVFPNADAITIHCTYDQYYQDIESKIAK